MRRLPKVSPIVMSSLFLLIAGTMAPAFAIYFQPREGPVGDEHRPVVEAIAAQNEIGHGHVWKIYVRASNPDGDLDKIQVTFSQVGAGIFAPDLLAQKSKNKNLNGYILVWSRLNGGGPTSDIHAEVDIRTEDRAGNLSEPKKMAFTVREIGKKDEFDPPAEFNKSVNLGQAEFPLQTDEGLVGGDGRGDLKRILVNKRRPPIGEPLFSFRFLS
jgi:hypothetical protein